MALYGIFLIPFLPLLPAVFAILVHPFLDVIDDRRAARAG